MCQYPSTYIYITHNNMKLVVLRTLSWIKAGVELKDKSIIYWVNYY